MENLEWDLSIIYKTKDDWNNDLEKFQALSNELLGYKGKLNDKTLFKEFLLKSRDASLLLNKIFNYAYMKKDLNQKNLDNQKDLNRVYGIYSEFSQKIAFADPEMLSVGKKILDWCKEDSEIEANLYSLNKLFRLEEHVRSSEVEEVIASLDSCENDIVKLYDSLAIADNYDVTVTLSNNEKLTVNNSNYRYYLGKLTNQEDRKIVFEAIFKFYYDHKNTFAGIYNGILDTDYNIAKNKGYESALACKLFKENIDLKVFHSLVETSKENTNLIKRYYELRKKYFKLDELHTYDRFIHLKESNKKYSYLNSRNMVLEACKKMGDDYYNKALKALDFGRVSVYPSDGKATGAYSTGTYKEGPYILLNHTDSLSSAFTIAHECGHSIHTLYANEAQKPETADYVIFVAEVASTFNEQLFLDYLVANIDDKDEKIVLLEQAIDDLIATFYRQTLFADFEYQAHSMVESGNAVTADYLSNIMTKLYMEYYDIDLNNEKYKDMVWASIPHLFHTPYYVYQYATSYSASLALYNKVKNGDSNDFAKYINLLKSGGSNDPVVLIKNAGVDLSTKEPFIEVVKRLEELLNELEANLA